MSLMCIEWKIDLKSFVEERGHSSWNTSMAMQRIKECYTLSKKLFLAPRCWLCLGRKATAGGKAVRARLMKSLPGWTEWLRNVSVSYRTPLIGLHRKHHLHYPELPLGLLVRANFRIRMEAEAGSPLRALLSSGTLVSFPSSIQQIWILMFKYTLQT